MFDLDDFTVQELRLVHLVDGSDGRFVLTEADKGVVVPHVNILDLAEFLEGRPNVSLSSAAVKVSNKNLLKGLRISVPFIARSFLVFTSSVVVTFTSGGASIWILGGRESLSVLVNIIRPRRESRTISLPVPHAFARAEGFLSLRWLGSVHLARLATVVFRTDRSSRAIVGLFITRLRLRFTVERVFKSVHMHQ